MGFLDNLKKKITVTSGQTNAGSRQVLCPYCLNELKPKDIKLVCPECGTVVSNAQQYKDASPKCTNPDCHTPRSYATVKQCGHEGCNAELPPDILDYPRYLRFSLIGTSGCGKSNFLTTMLHELRHAPSSPLVLSSMNLATQVMFSENEKLIYDDRYPVPATPPGQPPSPYQWRLRDRAKMTKTIIPSYSLTIFDGAGEDCANINPVISRYIKGSSTLLILIDPLALPGVKDEISKETYEASTVAEVGMDASAAIVDNLANYIRGSCGIQAGQIIARDVGVVFTKIDAVWNTFGHAVVTQPSPHLAKGGFLEADSEAVDMEIRDWLEMHNQFAFLNAIETNFASDRVRFFGVSSFGQPPSSSSQLAKVIPHRVLDPLLWMLNKEGIFPSLS